MNNKKGFPMSTPDDEAPRLRERSPDELTASVKARAERAKERASHRVSAADILEQREARVRDDVRTSGRRSGINTRVPAGIGAVLLVAAIATAYMSQSGSESHAAALARNEIIMTDLQAEHESLKSELAVALDDDTSAPAPELAAETVAEGLLSAAREAGQTVAELQNVFGQLLADDSAQSQDGVPGQGFLDSVEHRKELAPYFSEDTFVVDEALIYTPSSVLDLDMDQIDPRLPWYSGLAPCTWGVSAVNADGAGTGRADVIWLCNAADADGVLAWASGVWETSDETFTTISVGTVATATTVPMENTDAQPSL